MHPQSTFLWSSCSLPLRLECSMPCSLTCIPPATKPLKNPVNSRFSIACNDPACRPPLPRLAVSPL
ncbi:hypothetical protein BGY98DRAFT_976573, partial [Russula aff. rugulosa BPL654]